MGLTQLLGKCLEEELVPVPCIIFPMIKFTCLSQWYGANLQDYMCKGKGVNRDWRMTQSSMNPVGPQDVPPLKWLRSPHSGSPLCVRDAYVEEVWLWLQGTQNNPRLAALGWELQEQLAELRWRSSGYSPPANAGEHRFGPWSGKAPHAMEQLSQGTTSTGPACLQPVLHNKRSHQSEKPVLGK